MDVPELVTVVKVCAKCGAEWRGYSWLGPSEARVVVRECATCYDAEQARLAAASVPSPAHPTALAKLRLGGEVATADDDPEALQ